MRRASSHEFVVGDVNGEDTISHRGGGEYVAGCNCEC